MTAQLSQEELRALAVKKVESLKFAITQSAFTSIRRKLEGELQLAEFALAGLGSEPVAYFYPGDETEWQGVALTEELDDEQKARCIPLYAAPPAPVAVHDGLIDAFDQYARQFTYNNHAAKPEMFTERYPFFEAGYRAAMLNAGPVTGWIKCSERMPPENDQDIWLWNGSVQSGYIWNGDRFVDWNEEYQELRGVTHWMPMPLPAAPEQEV